MRRTKYESPYPSHENTVESRGFRDEDARDNRPNFEELRPERFGGRQSHYATGQSPYDQKNTTSRNPIRAAKGFHGVVRKPTHFLAGEAGEERVDISPMHKEIHRHHSRMQEHGWTGVLGAGKHLGRGIGHGGYTGIGSGGILGKYGGMSGNKKKSSFW